MCVCYTVCYNMLCLVHATTSLRYNISLTHIHTLCMYNYIIHINTYTCCSSVSVDSRSYPADQGECVQFHHRGSKSRHLSRWLLPPTPAPRSCRGDSLDAAGGRGREGGREGEGEGGREGGRERGREGEGGGGREGGDREGGGGNRAVFNGVFSSD